MKFKVMGVFVSCLLTGTFSFCAVSNASTLIRQTPKRMKTFFITSLSKDLMTIKKYDIGGAHPALTKISVNFNQATDQVMERKLIQLQTKWNVLGYALDELEIATRGLNKFSLEDYTRHEMGVEEEDMKMEDDGPESQPRSPEKPSYLKDHANLEMDAERESDEDMENDEPEPQPQPSTNYHIMSLIPMDEDSPFDDID